MPSPQMYQTISTNPLPFSSRFSTFFSLLFAHDCDQFANRKLFRQHFLRLRSASRCDASHQAELPQKWPQYAAIVLSKKEPRRILGPPYRLMQLILMGNLYDCWFSFKWASNLKPHDLTIRLRSKAKNANNPASLLILHEINHRRFPVGHNRFSVWRGREHLKRFNLFEL